MEGSTLKGLGLAIPDPMFHIIHSSPAKSIWVVGFQYFLFSPRYSGKIPILNVHIFSNGLVHAPTRYGTFNVHVMSPVFCCL